MNTNIKLPLIHSFSSFFTVNFQLLRCRLFSSSVRLTFLHVKLVLLLLFLSFFSQLNILFIFFFIPRPLLTNYHLCAFKFELLPWLSLDHCVKCFGKLICFLRFLWGRTRNRIPEDVYLIFSVGMFPIFFKFSLLRLVNSALLKPCTATCIRLPLSQLFSGNFVRWNGQLNGSSFK